MINYLKSGHHSRPGGNFNKLSITIHSTANLKSTADSERRWLDNPSNNRQASWHYCVDDTQTIAAIPENEEAWHCGNSLGNKTSISIEICESGDRTKALENAAVLVADILKRYGWGIGNIKKHKDWTGKNCPRILIDNAFIKKGMGWNYFLYMVVNNMKAKTDNIPDSYAKASVDKAVDKKVLVGDSKGNLNLHGSVTRQDLMVFLDRLGIL